MLRQCRKATSVSCLVVRSIEGAVLMGLKLHLTSKLFFALSKPEQSVKAHTACAKLESFQECCLSYHMAEKHLNSLFCALEQKKDITVIVKESEAAGKMFYRFFQNFYLWAEKFCHPVRQLFWTVNEPLSGRTWLTVINMCWRTSHWHQWELHWQRHVTHDYWSKEVKGSSHSQLTRRTQTNLDPYLEDQKNLACRIQILTRISVVSVELGFWGREKRFFHESKQKNLLRN